MDLLHQPCEVAGGIELANCFIVKSQRVGDGALALNLDKNGDNFIGGSEMVIFDLLEGSNVWFRCPQRRLNGRALCGQCETKRASEKKNFQRTGHGRETPDDVV